MAAVLHLGRIEFEARGSDRSAVSAGTPLSLVADLLGTDAAALEKVGIIFAGPCGFGALKIMCSIYRL